MGMEGLAAALAPLLGFASILTEGHVKAFTPNGRMTFYFPNIFQAN